MDRIQQLDKLFFFFDRKQLDNFVSDFGIP